jgi:succinoglycan biosynthesis transport protein ExoP
MSGDYPKDLDYGAGESGGSGPPDFLLDPKGIIRRRWRWMVASLIVGLAGTGAGVYFVKPRYEAEASVLITSQEIPENFVRSTVRESSMSNLNATVSQVLSNDNLERIIDRFELFEGLRPGVPLDTLANRMRGDIGIKPESTVAPGSRGQTSIVYRLSFESDSPSGAANVANALAALVVEASILKRNEQAQRITRFLQNALSADERDLRKQSRRVTEFRQSHRGQLPEELETSMRKLELLHERRAALDAKIAESQSQILRLRSGGAETELSENQILLEQLRVQLAREAALNTEEHPSVLSLRRRVTNVEALVAAEADPKTSLPPEVAALVDGELRDISRMRDQMAKIDDQVADLSARIDLTPSVSEELTALEQKETVLRENYLSSLRKVEQAELAETLEMAQQGAQVSILNRARPPSMPVRPRWMLLVGGIAASLAFALGVAVLLELIDPVVVSAGQLEKIADPRVLGSMPWVR